MNVHRIVVDGNVRMRQGYFEKELSAFDVVLDGRILNIAELLRQHDLIQCAEKKP